MQAIILAAGLGRRLGALTRENTKCMVQVAKTPLIARLLRQLDSCHLARIILVIGWQGEHLKNYVLSLNIQTPIIFIENPIFDKTNNIYSLSLTRDYLKEKDTLLIESDLILDDSILPKIIHHQASNSALVAKYQAGMDGTVVLINENKNITHFVQKNDFDFQCEKDYFKTVNIYKFSVEFINHYYLPFLDAYLEVCGNNEYYEYVLSIITILDKVNIAAVILENEKWCEIDDIADLNWAENLFGNHLLNKTQERFGGFWRESKLLDFVYLTNPYYPTERIKKELNAHLDLLLKEYPSGFKMQSILAGKHFIVPAENILLGNGAAEIIHALSIYLKNKKIALILPSFEEYANRFEKENLIIFNPKNKDFSYQAEDLILFLKNNIHQNNKPDAFILVNPDNPTGNFIDKNQLIVLAEFCKENKILLVIDESFVDFADIKQSLMNVDFLKQYPNVLIIKSISKTYGVAGLRLGVVASGDENKIDALKKELSIWNINSFAEFFMQIASHFESDYILSLNYFKKERERFFNDLKSLKHLHVIPSFANYFLCEIKKPFLVENLMHDLFQKNILIKNCSSKKAFENKPYVRIAIKDKESNLKLFFCLKEFFNE